MGLDGEIAGLVWHAGYIGGRCPGGREGGKVGRCRGREGGEDFSHGSLGEVMEAGVLIGMATSTWIDGDWFRWRWRTEGGKSQCAGIFRQITTLHLIHRPFFE